MAWPADFPITSDLSTITIKTEVRASSTASTSAADYYTYEYIHIPIFVWCIFAILVIWIGGFFLREFVIRWRKKL